MALLFVFFLLLNVHQSGPPGQIMQAGSLIMADTILAKLGWNFLDDSEDNP